MSENECKNLKIQKEQKSDDQELDKRIVDLED